MRFMKITGLCLALMTSLLLFTTALASNSIAYLFCGNANGLKVHNGLADTSVAVLTDGVSYANRTATLIQPKENVSAQPLEIMHNTLADADIKFLDRRFVVYEYIYLGTKTDLRPTLTLYGSDFNFTAEEKTAAAMHTLTMGSLNYIIFDVGDYMGGYRFTDGAFPKMTFRPYGDIPACELAESDKLYISQIMFWTKTNMDIKMAEAKLTYKYPVYFSAGRADAVGEDPEVIYAEVGESVTLPENPYTLDGYRFKGWVRADGDLVCKASEKAVIVQKTPNGAGAGVTGRTYFIADWGVTGDVGSLPDIKTVKFYNYNMGSNGIMDAKYGQYIQEYEKNCVFDGVRSVRYKIMEKDSDCYKIYQNLVVTDKGKSKNNAVILDGWGWTSMPLDIKHYKYCAVLYYWKSNSPLAITPSFNILKGNTGALKDSVGIKGTKILEQNKWAIMEFPMDFETHPYLSQYTEFEVSTVANQVHFRPFGNTKLNYLYGDELYIADVVFFSEAPSEIRFSDGFISGNTDGTFKPKDNLTRAQAVTIAARAMGYNDSTADTNATTTYTDVAESAWYYGAVCFLEKKGVLKPDVDGKLFNGNAYCDKSDYIRLLVNASAGITGASERDDGLYGSAAAGKLTRAEAVVYANGILRGAATSRSDVDFMAETGFTDVSYDSWYGPDIVLSSNDIMLSKNSDGITSVCALPAFDSERGEDVLTSVPEEIYAETDAYIKELDELTSKRINEIRSTASQYKLKEGGTIYYVSSTVGSKSSKGTSQSTPRLVEALKDVALLPVKAGDVVLFRRGDTFTGTLATVAGVTYSAYGYGDKPLFVKTPLDAGKESSWSIAYEDAATGSKIWKYHDETIIDVGGINLIDSDGKITVAYKEIPNFSVSEHEFIDKYTPVIYDYRERLDSDLMFFHEGCAYGLVEVETENEDGTVTKEKVRKKVSASPTDPGPLYLRCDKGNPASVYSDITFNVYGHGITAQDDVTIDNICIKYFGSHGISAGTRKNLTVTNCEIGWGGGAIQHYTNGVVTRFGNGVEIYGGLTNYRIDNCYVYEIYDAGITHQISSSNKDDVFMEGVYYTNNVLINSSYNIEYFMSKNGVNSSTGKADVRERMMKDVYFTGNIARMAGYGWGVQRPDSAPSNIKGWSHHNLCINYVIENNVFDRCLNLRSVDDYIVEVGASYDNSTPYFKNNIFVQVPGRTLMRYGKGYYKTNLESENLLNTISGDGNKLYLHRDDRKLYEGNVYWDKESVTNS